MEKFLIINPFGIGDCLFTTPVIRAIKEKRPDSFIGYWCNERVSGLLKDHPGIDKVFALSRGDIKRIYRGLNRFLVLFNLIGKIKKEKFDIAFDFSLDSRYGLWSKLAGIKRRIGFDYKDRGRFLTDKIPLSGYSDRHVVEYYKDLLKFVNTGIDNAALNLIVNKESAARAKNMLAGYGVNMPEKVIGIAMGGGASWGRDAIYKQWPAEKFRELVAILIKDQNVKVVLLGSVEEKPLAEIACPTASYPQSGRRASAASRPRNDDDRIINLTGKLSLGELAAVIKELKLLICNDGGPLHMAVALGINTLSVFGPVDETVYGPYPPDRKHVVVKKDISCRPCYKNFNFNGCDNSKHCLEDIAVSEVYEKAKALLCNVT